MSESEREHRIKSRGDEADVEAHARLKSAADEVKPDEDEGEDDEPDVQGHMRLKS